jgi:lysophospholipase L1-like esterase
MGLYVLEYGSEFLISDLKALENLRSFKNFVSLRAAKLFNQTKIMKQIYRLIAVATLSVVVFSTFAQSPKKDINIVFIGNSITYGANLEHPETDAPPVIVAKNCAQVGAVGTIAFSNQGHNGYTTLDFLPHTKAFDEAETAARAFGNKQALLIFSIDLGTNDSAIKGPRGAPVAPKDYRANLKTISDALLMDFPGCVVMINHPIWYSANTYNGAMYLQEGLDRLQSYFPEIDGLVADYRKSPHNRVFVGDVIAFDYFKTNYLTDLTPEEGHQGTFYLHPNKKGAAALGNFWADAIYKTVKRVGKE